MEQSARRWRLVSGGGLAAVALMGLDGGIAVWAQHAGRVDAAVNGYPFEGYSLTKHLLAMLVLAALTVGLAATLVRITGRFPAFLVIVGVAAGPMTVIAAPVRASLVSSFDDTVPSWHLQTGTAQAVILLLAAFWVARQVPVLPLRVTGPRHDGALFAVVTAAALTVQIVTASGIDQEPGLMPSIGWALLAAGLTVTAVRSVGLLTPSIPLVVGGSVLAVLLLAYIRDGGSGWPGVAGWETFAQSPVILSRTTPFVLLTGPAAILIARATAIGRAELTSTLQRDGAHLAS